MIRRAARIIVVAAVGGVILAAMFGRLYEDRILYHPDRELSVTPAAGRLTFDDVWVTARDGVRVHGWYVHAAAPRALVIVSHGNGGNIANRIGMAAVFAREGMDTLLYDYRGYGRSEGTPSEEGLYLDGEAVRRWAIERTRLPVVLYGESLGGAVAVELAVQAAPALLVVQSGFTSLREMANRVLPVVGGLVVRQRFDALARIRRLGSPLLVVHGDQDEIVPYPMGQRLFAAAPGRKEMLTVPGGHHNDLFERAGAEIARRVQGLAVGR